jgi:hypothetical protein
MSKRNSSFYVVRQLIHLTFHYEFRHDKLRRRQYDLRTNNVQEFYWPGRADHLQGNSQEPTIACSMLTRSYQEYIYDVQSIDEHRMKYYDRARFDGLSMRYKTQHELTDWFVKRDDYLEYRRTIYDRQCQRTITVNSRMSTTTNNHRNVHVAFLVGYCTVSS